MDDRSRSPLRILAPVALIAVAVVFSFIVLTSDGAGGSESSRDAQRTGERQAPKKPKVKSKAQRREDELPSSAYTVKMGDTLGAIAVKTGLTVEKLQELNPELDPQALVSGQRVKLRE